MTMYCVQYIHVSHCRYVPMTLTCLLYAYYIITKGIECRFCSLYTHSDERY